MNDMRPSLAKSADDALYSLMAMCMEGESNKFENAVDRVVNAVYTLSYDGFGIWFGYSRTSFGSVQFQAILVC